MASSRSADPAVSAHAILRSARRGTLATLETANHHPLASLVAVATDISGRPLMMLSKLARHTRNLEADPRASLLLEDLVPGDPLANGRISLSGRLVRVEDAAARRRFLARQAGASYYADLPDFGLFRLEVEHGHLVAGFGRIADILPTAILDGDEAGIGAREADIAAHMNEDHADAVALYATALLGEGSGKWRFDGLDRRGCEISLDYRARYLPFENPLKNPDEARMALVELVKRARDAG